MRDYDGTNTILEENLEMSGDSYRMSGGLRCSADSADSGIKMILCTARNTNFLKSQSLYSGHRRNVPDLQKLIIMISEFKKTLIFS